MMKPWGPLAVAATLMSFVGQGVATAQTVIVRKAPPGSPVELVLNAATIGTAKANDDGDAILPVNLTTSAGKVETEANVYIDICDEVRRVLLVERAQQPPPPGPGCARTHSIGIYIIRRVSTIVVDVGGPTPTVLLRQGSVSLRPPRVWSPSPTGLVLSAGGGWARIRDARTLACGNVEPCTGENSGGAYAFGATFWLTRFLGADVAYVKPPDVTASGSGEAFRFDSSLNARFLTIAAKIGVPIGPVRLYGQVGANRHRALFATTQTMDDTTVTIDDVAQTIEGGTVTFDVQTEGWGWGYGGGAEAWLHRRFAIYGEGGLAALKGSAREDGEGRLDDRVTYVMFGARLGLGR